MTDGCYLTCNCGTEVDDAFSAEVGLSHPSSNPPPPLPLLHFTLEVHLGTLVVGTGYVGTITASVGGPAGGRVGCRGAAGAAQVNVAVAGTLVVDCSLYALTPRPTQTKVIKTSNAATLNRSLKSCLDNSSLVRLELFKISPSSSVALSSICLVPRLCLFTLV
jgi:hypothetical protein